MDDPYHFVLRKKGKPCTKPKVLTQGSQENVEMAMKIGSIVVKSTQFDKMLVFWTEALHYVPGATADNGFVILRDPRRERP